jgi:DNA invertase Pin-like site-specific DNA recombinase
MERPALQRLLVDIEASKIDILLVYEVTCSLTDFSRMIVVIERLRKRRMGRLTAKPLQALHHGNS